MVKRDSLAIPNFPPPSPTPNEVFRREGPQSTWTGMLPALHGKKGLTSKHKHPLPPPTKYSGARAHNPLGQACCQPCMVKRDSLASKHKHPLLPPPPPPPSLEKYTEVDMKTASQPEQAGCSEYSPKVAFCACWCTSFSVI